MEYKAGGEVKIGDHVALGADIGVVVFSIDRDEYSSRFRADEWAYLGKGVMLEFPNIGLVYIEEAPDDLLLIERDKSHFDD